MIGLINNLLKSSWSITKWPLYNWYYIGTCSAWYKIQNVVSSHVCPWLVVLNEVELLNCASLFGLHTSLITNHGCLNIISSATHYILYAYTLFLGEDAVPKGIPKTIENQRVPDETIIHGIDEEVGNKPFKIMRSFISSPPQLVLDRLSSQNCCVRSSHDLSLRLAQENCLA